MNDKVIQIGGKSYKECGIAMLPTENPSSLFINTDTNLLEYYYNGNRQYFHKWQHLYILSSEEIKEGNQYLIYNGQICKTFTYGERRDICFKIDNDIVYCQNNKWRKIIATTDSEVKIHVGTCFSMEELFKPLPRPSDDFIKAYVKAQGKIDKVLVEYYNLNGQESGQLIKIASDNTITIKPVQEVYVSKKALPFVIEALGFDPTKEKEKTSWNRNEVIEIIKCFSVALQERKSGHVYDFRDKWIKENLK